MSRSSAVLTRAAGSPACSGAIAHVRMVGAGQSLRRHADDAGG
jgi:hypothetical protein